MSRRIYENDIPEDALGRLEGKGKERYLIWQYFFVPNMRENTGLWRRIIDNLFPHQERTVAVEVIQSEYIENFYEEQPRAIRTELQAEAVMRVNGNDIYRVYYPITNGTKNCLHIFKIAVEPIDGRNGELQGTLGHKILVMENMGEAMRENEVYLEAYTHEIFRMHHWEELIPLLMLISFFDSDEVRRGDRVFWLTYVKAGLENLTEEKCGWSELYYTRKIINIWNDVCKEVFSRYFGLSLEIQCMFLPYLQCESGIVENSSKAERDAKTAIAYVEMREDMIRKVISREKANGTEPEECAIKLQKKFELSAEEAAEKMKKYDF